MIIQILDLYFIFMKDFMNLESLNLIILSFSNLVILSFSKNIFFQKLIILSF